MEIKQKTVIEIEREGKVFQMICASDAPLGCLFDVLMEMKGWCVERMQKAHKEEAEQAEEHLKDEPEPEQEENKEE